MSILINHTLRSIRQNLGQFIVILVTLTFVTAILFVAFSIGDLFYNFNLAANSRLGSETDVTLSGDVFSETKLNEFLQENAEQVEYADCLLQMGGLFRASVGKDRTSKAVLIEAADLSEFALRHPRSFRIKEQYEFSYEFPPVWVGASFAEENNLSAGDVVEIYNEMYLAYQKMTVIYIMENEGVFANSVVNTLMVDFSSANNKGLVNLANIKLTEGTDADVFMERLYAHMENPSLSVDPSVDYARIERVVQNNQTLLSVSLIFIIALMLFILFTSYLIVAKNRMGEMILFKAAGASPMQITGIMLSEALIYGIFGAVFGLFIGRIGMGIAVNAVIPNFTDAVRFTAGDYIFALLLGILVSVAAAVLPSMQIAQKSVRTLESGERKEVFFTKPLVVLILFLLLTASALLLAFIPAITLPATVALTLFSILFVFSVIPYLLKFFSRPLQSMKASALAGVSVKRNVSAHTLTGMLAGIVIFSFLVVSIINVIVYAVTPFNARFSSDFVIEGIGDADLLSAQNSVKDIYGVKVAYLYRYDSFIWREGDATTEYVVYGTDNAAALLHVTEGLDNSVMERFDATLNPVVISYDLAERFEIRVGAEITLRLGDAQSAGKELYGSFTVVGIDRAMTQNDRVMFIRNDAFRVEREAYMTEDAMLFIVAEDGILMRDLYHQLREKVEGKYCYILQFEDWAYATSVGMRGVVTLMRILEVAVSLVAFIGILNLIIVSFLERRREFFIYRSLGMDSGYFTKTVLFEGLLTACTGGVAGLLLSLAINQLLPTFSRLIDRYISLTVFPLPALIVTGAAVVLFVAVYLAASLSRKMATGVFRQRA